MSWNQNQGGQGGQGGQNQQNFKTIWEHRDANGQLILSPKGLNIVIKQYGDKEPNIVFDKHYNYRNQTGVKQATWFSAEDVAYIIQNIPLICQALSHYNPNGAGNLQQAINNLLASLGRA